ncbi:hypothetical protein HDU96_010240 [Phlyctochytrium bullatum]|nr:hypothetical protein HDU96_010240 [Phlyctochytrium bullatum]
MRFVSTLVLLTSLLACSPNAIWAQDPASTGPAAASTTDAPASTTDAPASSTDDPTVPTVVVPSSSSSSGAATVPAATPSPAEISVPPPAVRSQLGRLEPPDGKLYFGAWIDTSPEGKDSPRLFNQRIGRKASVFQMAQTIPVELDPVTKVRRDFNFSNLDDNSDGVILLTVYPYFGFESVTDAALQDLSDQLTEIYRRTRRSVLIRYAPEMNFEWMPYGQKPAEFIASFQKLADYLHARNPNAATLWSPNFDSKTGTTYEQYYPGDEYVDWVGLSVYFKGTRATWPWIRNDNPPADYFDQLVDATGPEGGPVPFYRTFAAGKGKPFALSEGAATFHVNYSSTGPNGTFTSDPFSPGVTQTTLQMTWWNGFLFNPAYLDSHPLLKLVCLFEYAKPENESTYLVNRDFRSTWDPTLLTAFKAGLDSIATRIVWANESAVLTTTSAAVTTAARTASSSASVTAVTSAKPSSAASAAPASTSTSGAAGTWAGWASVGLAAGVGAIGFAMASMV